MTVDAVRVGGLALRRVRRDGDAAVWVRAAEWARAYGGGALTAERLVELAPPEARSVASDEETALLGAAAERALVTAEHAARVLAPGDVRAAAACARATFFEPTPLPPQLPAVEEIRAATALLAGGDDEAGGDDGAEGAEGETAAAAAEGGGGTRLELSADDLSGGLVGHHIALLQTWASVGIDLSRSTVRMQGAVSIRNIAGDVRRYLKFCAAETSAANVTRNGLFLLADGPLLLKFISFMANGKRLKLATVTASAYALQKGVEFVARSLAPEPGAVWDAYCGSVRVLLSQLQARRRASPPAADPEPTAVPPPPPPPPPPPRRPGAKRPARRG